MDVLLLWVRANIRRRPSAQRCLSVFAFKEQTSLPEGEFDYTTWAKRIFSCFKNWIYGNAIPLLFCFCFSLLFFFFCLLLVSSFSIFFSLQHRYCHLWIIRPNRHTRNSKRARGHPSWGENASSVARAPTQGFLSSNTRKRTILLTVPVAHSSLLHSMAVIIGFGRIMICHGILPWIFYISWHILFLKSRVR